MAIARLMNQLNKDNEVEGKSLWFFCPGCKEPHRIPVEKVLDTFKEIPWDWNGSLEKPTTSPSILTTGNTRRCHSYVKDGKIQFLSDCSHELAGQTVDLPELPKWLEEENK